MGTTFILTVVTLAALGLILAVILFFVAKQFQVKENPLIDVVEAAMPGANCGGCGFAGCRAFAEACVKSGNLDGKFCPVGGNDVMKKVGEAMGVVVEEKAPMVAVVRCNGSCENRPRTNIYDGSPSCKVVSILYSGDTDCRYGCLGGGDCVQACPFDAIRINPQTLLPEVDEEKCTACGNCVRVCPKGIIELRNKGLKGRRVFVSCLNKDKGAVARKACSAACIGCRKCEKICPFGAITVENNLAYIDFNKCKLCRKCVDECPTGAIHTANFPPRPPKAAETAQVKPAAPVAASAENVKPE